jgi:hypothetical protein
MNVVNNGTLGLIADQFSERSTGSDRLRYTKNPAVMVLAFPSAQQSRSHTIEREIGDRDVRCPDNHPQRRPSPAIRLALTDRSAAFRI